VAIDYFIEYDGLFSGLPVFKRLHLLYTWIMDSIKKGGDINNEHFYAIPADFLARFSENPLSEFLTVTDIGQFFRAKHHYCSRPGGIDEAVFIYCAEGSGFCGIDGDESRIINAGQTLIIPPGTAHDYGALDNNPWTIFWMHIKGRYFDAFYRCWQSPPPALFHIPEIHGGRIRELFYQCFDILKMPYQWEEFCYLCQLAAAMISLIPGAVKQAAGSLTANGNRGIEAAVAYMKNHLRESVTLEELAGAAGFSPSHLHYLFRKYSDYAPVEYFLRMKIQAAAKDIFFSGLAIRKIAESYGIEDPYYFSRLFKKITGLSPLQYRNSPLHIGGRPLHKDKFV
jgi:AraC-like DNA-binding protein